MDWDVGICVLAACARAALNVASTLFETHPCFALSASLPTKQRWGLKSVLSLSLLAEHLYRFAFNPTDRDLMCLSFYHFASPHINMRVYCDPGCFDSAILSKVESLC